MFKKITIDALVLANQKKVWDFFNNPKHITQWNYALDEWHCPTAENDLRVGGKLKARMEAKDGSFGFDFEATYDEVIELKKIAYTIPDGRKVVTTFEETKEGTKIVTVFDAENENPMEMQKNGWQAILNNFQQYTQKTK